MIDEITKYIIEQEDSEDVDNLLEGYDLKCQSCGRVITIVKDGQGPLACCNNRMIVMGSQAEPGEEEVDEVQESEFVKDIRETLASADPTPKEQEDMEEGLRKILSGETVNPDFQVRPKDVNFSPFNQAEVQKDRDEEKEKEGKKKVSEAGFETKPKGWTDSSVKKFGKSLVKGGGKEKGFFDKCVKKMKDKIDNPEGFCASVKDEAYDSTYWRGKDKTPQEIGKDVKKHKNV